MSPGARLWLRVAIGTGVAAALLVGVAPTRPAPRLAWFAAVPAGAAAGVLLFVLVARRLPRPPYPRPSLVGRVAFLGIWATNEEVVWRRVALGELLGAGVVVALAASTAGFALAHRGRAAAHVGTGFIFGALYVGTGALVASVAAHWAYNILVAGLVERTRRG